jgi:tetratricopeptide (TPR) repeat protein
MTPDSSERERALMEAIESGAGDLDCYLEAADILLVSGRSEEALAILAKASNLDLTEVQRGLLLNEQAQFLARTTNRKDEAFALAERAVSVLARQAPTLDIWIAEASAEGLMAEAIWDSDHPRAVGLATHAIETARRVSEMEIDPEWYASNSDPNAPGRPLWILYFTAAHLFARMARFDEAAEWFRRVLAEPLPADYKIGSLIDLGSVLRQAGRNEGAEKVLQEAAQSARTRRQNQLIYHELGLVKRALKRPTEAKALFEKALQEVNADPLLASNREIVDKLYLEIADACYAAGHRDAAAQVYRDALALLPRNDPAYAAFRLSIARVEVERKNFEDARDTLLDLTEVGPDEVRSAAKSDLAVLGYLISLRSYETRDYRASVEQCEKLLKDLSIDENLRAHVLLLLGHSYGGLGRFAQASHVYSELIKSPSAPEDLRNSAKEWFLRLPLQPRPSV